MEEENPWLRLFASRWQEEKTKEGGSGHGGGVGRSCLLQKVSNLARALDMDSFGFC